MKILIVDDQKVPAETLKLAIEAGLKGSIVEIHGMFDTAFERVQLEMPDAVVLDIFQNPANDENRGDAVSEKLWDRHFCPLVIYTARPQENHRRMAGQHPFVKLSEKKGSKESDGEVVGHLKNFAPHAEVLRQVRNDAIKAIGDSLRDVCGVIWRDETTNDPAKKAELIGRIAKRRVAAAMDALASVSAPLRPWEQYVYPPICPDLLTGDILCKKNGSETTFCVVVWPSCDLVRDRKGCLERVLVAACESIESFLKAAQLLGAKPDKIRERLPVHLTADQVSGFLCLPELPGVLPVMSINLKNLAIIEMGEIAIKHEDKGAFRRVASVDSPFRERIAFAFNQVSGRPGLPDIDRAQVVESILKNLPDKKADAGEKKC